MKTRPLSSCILAAALAFTGITRADETATAPPPSTDALVAAIVAGDPANSATRLRRDTGGKVVELHLSPRVLTPEILAELRHARDLQALSVGCCTLPIGKDLAPSLAELHRLNSLRMLGCGADVFPKLPPRALGQLRSLFVGYQAVTAEISTAIARLPELEQLEVCSFRKLAADDLAPLAACPKLKALNLSFTNAGDDLVEILIGMKATLKTLDLRSTEFTAIGIDRLREAGLIVRTK